MIHRISRAPRTALVPILILAVAGFSVAEEEPDFSRALRRSGAHQISGFVTIGLAATVATLGLTGSDLHPGFGWALAGSSAITVGLGSLAYRDRALDVWPHTLLATLATVGFFMNAFETFPPGSTEHVIVGASSVGLLAGAYLAIVILTL